MRSRHPGKSVSNLALAALLVHLTAGSTRGQTAKAQDKQALSPWVEKDVPYGDGGDEQTLDLYLPEKKGFTTVSLR